MANPHRSTTSEHITSHLVVQQGFARVQDLPCLEGGLFQACPTQAKTELVDEGSGGLTEMGLRVWCQARGKTAPVNNFRTHRISSCCTARICSLPRFPMFSKQACGKHFRHPRTLNYLENVQGAWWKPLSDAGARHVAKPHQSTTSEHTLSHLVVRQGFARLQDLAHV